MQMEKDGKLFYKEIVEKTSDEGLNKIFNMFISDEEKHYELLKKMKESQDLEFKHTEILFDVKNIFQDLKDKNTVFDFNSSQIEIYKKAQEIEKRSEDFYKKRASEIDNAEQKAIVLKIADEEKKHYFLLEKIIEFVSRPETWIENAEFNHLDEY